MEIYRETTFKYKSLENIVAWISLNRDRLIRSAIFTKNKSLVSKLVSWVESLHCKNESFIPSHTGSIVEYKGEICLFDMKPPKAAIQNLAEYLFSTDDEFVLIMRDFDLDTKMFSSNVTYHIGEFYPYLSAIRSVMTKRQTKWVRHCSELHLRELQKQELFINLNPEITPDELYHVLLGENK